MQKTTQVLSQILALMLLILWIASSSYAQTITRKGDTLIATPAKAYQWLKNGAVINGATEQKLVPTEKANYSVRLNDRSDEYFYKVGGYTMVSGLVYNEKLEPVANASVNINGVSATTDAKGRYILRTAVTERMLTRVSHNDYNPRTLGFVSTDAETLFKDIRIEKFAETHSFDAKRSTMLGTNGFVMYLQDSAIINEKTGQPYYGKVSAHITSHQNGDALFGEQMPGGDFLGITKDGQENILYSFGFFSCELKGEKGEKLNLAKGQTAKVYFDVPPNQRNRMQDSIPLWHFDEDKGTWIEIGITKRVVNTYMGEVSHFSSWNVDYSTPPSWVEGEVINCDSTNVGGGTVYTEQIPVQVDSKGYYKGGVQTGMNIDIFSSDQKKQYTTPQLAPDQTDRVPKFAVNRLKGFGVIDENCLLTIAQMGGVGKIQYSIDGGKTFQTGNQFQLSVNDCESVSCIVRDENGCENHFEAKKIKGIFQDCELIDIEIINNRYFIPLVDYLYDTEAVDSMPHQFSIDGNYDFLEFQENIGLMGCLQGIHFDGVENIDESQIWESLLYSPQLQLIRVNNQNLSTIPDMSNWQNLRSLNLDINNLTSLPDGIEKWKNIKELSFARNQLKNLPEQIKKWENIQILTIHSNQLNFLPAEVGEWKNLTRIDLNYNRLSSLPVEVGEWKNLTSISLIDNDFATLPVVVGEWKKLTSIYLGQNGLITTLPSEVGEWKNLNYLYLQANRLTSLPAEVGEWKNLTNVSFEINKLISLPAEVREWVNLENLNVKNNKLTSLPAGVGGWTSLKILDLSDNQLNSLPDEVREWKNLAELNLSFNQFTSLPEVLGECKNLTKLGLRDNQLTSLPAEVEKWTSLKNLDLSNNKITSLPLEVRGWTNMKELTLINNQLRSLPSEVREWKNLNVLNLSNNKLKSLPSEVSEWKNLSKLDLANNDLDSLPPEIAEWKNLSELNLKNYLFKLRPEIANLKDNLRYLYLEGIYFSQEERAKIQGWLPNTKIYW